jgi:iron complex outermembrane receptor protein
VKQFGWVSVLALLAAEQAIAQTNQPSSETASAPANQDSEGLGLADIVVTAQRRSESAQRAAISIDTISTEQIERSGLTSADQLTQLVPALRTDPGQGPYVNFTVRGISNFGVNSFADGAVVLSADGVPQAHPVSANGLFFDLERVEVLKGPQGTLYGRNATGGAVNLISRRPQFKLGGSASIEYGNFERIVASAAVNVPLADRLAARVAFQRVKRDGYFTDGTGDEDSIAVRGSLRFEPSEGVRFLAVADHSEDSGRGVGVSLLTSRANPPLGPTTGVTQPTFGPYVGLSDARNAGQFTAVGLAPRNFLPFQQNSFNGVLLQAEVDTSIGTLTVLPAYREADLLYLSSFPTFYLGEQTSSRQYSVEARLASDDDQPLRYIVGAYYLDDALAGQTIIEVAPTISNQRISTTTRSLAGFGQLTLALSDTLRLVGGLRYTSEHKRTDSTRLRIAPFNFATTSIFPFPAANAGIPNLELDRDRRFKATTWRAGVEWEPGDASLVYANVSTGFKAGGFYFGPADKSSYEPERVTAYLLGTKNRFMDGRLQVNAEAFYMDYKDQQISYFGFTSAGTSFITENIGAARIHGAEADIQFRATRNTRLGLNAQWLEGKYQSFNYVSGNPVADTQTCPSRPATGGGFQLDCSGRRVLQLPRWVLSASLQQRIPLGSDGAIVLDASSRYESARETSLSYLPETRVGDYTRSDASISYESADDVFSASLFVRNIEDDAVIVRVQPGRTYSRANGGLLGANYQAPRTYGVRLGFRY